MKPAEANRVHVNHCVLDEEIERLEALLGKVDPGTWRVAAGKVERYGGKPIEKPESLSLMAEAIEVVPRLLRGIRALEESLRTAWAEAASWKATVIEERRQHAEDHARYAFGETGPVEDLAILLEAVELGCFYPRAAAVEITAWAAGKATQKGIHAVDIERARRTAAEKKRSHEELRAQMIRDAEELRVLLAELRLTKREREDIAARVKATLAAGRPA